MTFQRAIRCRFLNEFSNEGVGIFIWDFPYKLSTIKYLSQNMIKRLFLSNIVKNMHFETFLKKHHLDNKLSAISLYCVKSDIKLSAPPLTNSNSSGADFLAFFGRGGAENFTWEILIIVKGNF